MRKIKLPYHKQLIEIEIDDKNLAGVLESKAGEYKTKENQSKIVEKALDNTIGDNARVTVIPDGVSVIVR